MPGNFDPMGYFLQSRGMKQDNTLREQEIEQRQMQLDADRRMQAALLERAQQRGPAPSPSTGAAPGAGGPGAAAQPQQSPRFPESISDTMDEFARIAADAGAIDKASKYSEKASMIRKHNAEAEGASLKAQIQKWNTAGSLLEGVKDQQSWDEAVDRYEQITRERSPFRGTPYDPNRVEQLKQGIQTAKDRADTKLKTTQNRVAEANVTLTKARERLANARAEHIGKTGGTTKVVAGDLKAATDLIERDYRGISPEESRIYGRQIVERARELMTQNLALTKAQAMAKAYHEKRASGVFAPYAQMKPKESKSKYTLPDGRPLTPGMVVDGYAWTGGPPDSPNSWEAKDEGGDEEGEE